MRILSSKKDEITHGMPLVDLAPSSPMEFDIPGRISIAYELSLVKVM